MQLNNHGAIPEMFLIVYKLIVVKVVSNAIIGIEENNCSKINLKKKSNDDVIMTSLQCSQL